MIANSPADHKSFWEAVLRNTQSLARGDGDGVAGQLAALHRARALSAIRNIRDAEPVKDD